MSWQTARQTTRMNSSICSGSLRRLCARPRDREGMRGPQVAAQPAKHAESAATSSVVIWRVPCSNAGSPEPNGPTDTLPTSVPEIPPV